MDLLPYFQWCYNTPIGEGIRNSTWLFPVIEAFHLLGLGLTAGAVLVVDLRLLGGARFSAHRLAILVGEGVCARVACCQRRVRDV